VAITADIPEDVLLVEEPPPPHDIVTAAIAAARRNALSLNMLVSPSLRPATKDLL
jgi:hypothetical protein